MGEDQWRSESSLETSVKNNAKPAAVSLPKANQLRNWLWVGVGLFVLLLIFSGILIFRKLVNNNLPDSAALTSDIKVQEVDLSQIGKNVTTINTESSDKVVINGQIQANQGIVLTPGVKPTGPVIGQVYFDKSTNQVTYFDGSGYVSFASDVDISSIQNSVSNLQGQVATLLAAVNQLSGGGTVLSLQGLASNITLSGTNGLTITANGQVLSLNLP
ncbi:MAG: hypothetical protein AAB459_01855, partial [Patescibacteria group bacterium]